MTRGRGSRKPIRLPGSHLFRCSWRGCDQPCAYIIAREFPGATSFGEYCAEHAFAVAWQSHIQYPYIRVVARPLF